MAYLCVPTKGPTWIVVETVGAGARKSVCFCNLRRWSVGCHQRLRSRWTYFPPGWATLASVESRIAFWAEAIKVGAACPVIQPRRISAQIARPWGHRLAQRNPRGELGSDSIPPKRGWLHRFQSFGTASLAACLPVLVADAEIGVGIVAIPAPLTEDPRQRHIASFKGFGSRLLGLSDRSNEPDE